jgi:formylmethanofuran dehydrogenase subunit E
MELQDLLAISNRDHSHLCPRQILGVRMGLAGLAALNFAERPENKRLLVIAETDGCFVDGVSAATCCSVGRRTLRIEDYGKVAATFVDTHTGYAVRAAPTHDVRQRAYAYAPAEPRHYFAQMQAYQIMPDEELLSLRPVELAQPLETILSRPGVRVNCARCGEEIINEREVVQDGLTICRSCAGGRYYCHADEPIAVPLVDFFSLAGEDVLLSSTPGHHR